MDESENTQNRRSRRSHLMMSASLEVSGRAISVKLRNLSAEGAQVEGDGLPVEGTDLLFRRGSLAVVGRIVWIKGKQAGIRFEEKLDTEAVLNHVPVPRARTTADFRRPGLTTRALTDQERKLGEQWIAGGPRTPYS